MVLTDTNITEQYFCHRSLGYNVVCLPISITSVESTKGRVRLFFCDQLQGWSVESTRFHGTNVVSCEVVTNIKRTVIIGVYLPPYTLEHLIDLEDSLIRFQDQYPIVVGYLSTNIGKPRTRADIRLLTC